MTPRRRYGYVAAVAMAAAIVLPLAVSQPAVAAPETAVRDSTADTREVPAYDENQAVDVFDVKFDAKEGQRFYITSRINAEQGSSTPDEVLMAAITVKCDPASKPAESVSATQNTVRGTTTSLTPRFVYTAQTEGEVECRLFASGSRPREAGGDPESNVWQVGKDSFLSASVATTDWSRTMLTGKTSRVLEAGEQWSPNQHTISVGDDVSEFELITDHKVTACTAEGGSSDETTDGKQLCEGRMDPTGTDLDLEVFVRQRTDDNQWCGEAVRVHQESDFVSKDEHHKMLTSKAKVDVDPQCGAARFEMYSTISPTAGSDLMIHAPNEVMLALPTK